MEAGTRSRRAVGALAVAVVATVAGLSLASSLTGGDGAGAGPGASPTSTGRTEAAVTTAPVLRNRSALPAPTPGRFAGRLAYVDSECRLVVIDLLSVRARIAAVDLPGCHVQLSAGGRFGVLSARAGARVEVADLTSGQATAVGLGPRLGPPGYGQPAVADDGTVAVCSTSARTGEASVVSVALGSGRRSEVEGCRPAFAGTRLLVASRDRQAAVRDALGAIVVPRRALPRPSRGDLVIATSADAGLLGVLSRTESLDHVDLSLFTTDGKPRGSWLDFQSGADLRTLRIASTGTAAAADVNGIWRLGAVRGDRIDAVETVADARIAEVDFSPDGQQAAVVVDDGILLVDAGTLGPLAAIRADARSVRWLP